MSTASNRTGDVYPYVVTFRFFAALFTLSLLTVGNSLQIQTVFLDDTSSSQHREGGIGPSLLLILLFTMAQRPLVSQSILIVEVLRSHSHTHTHTHTHITLYDSSGRKISSSQRLLPDNTQQTHIHIPSGFRTHNPSKRAAADPCFRPRGRWDRHAFWRRNYFFKF